MPEVPAVPGTAALGAAVAAAFADDGVLARAVDHFEPRESQRTMAAAVASTLQHGGVLLAEAGTGTGKTLAYLVPAILNRQRVLISTGTKNLQEQIYFKDIPALRAALGVPFTATCMKGRANYLCLHRLDQLRAHPASPQDFVSMMDEWRRVTETGDRAELSDLPEDSAWWSDVAATAETCLGSECPQYRECYVTKMRQRAAESDVVIVNHHLLCADASVRQSTYGEVIPDCHYAIIDEAHHLEDVATQYFGISVSNYRVADLVRDAERALNLGQIDDPDSELRHAIRRVDDHSLTFFAALAMARRARGNLNEERLRIGPQWFGDVLDDGLGLTSALNALEQAMKTRSGNEEAGAQVNEDAATIGRRAGELRDNLTFLLEAADPAFVYFLETRNRGVFLRAAPIDVSAIVREMLIDRMRATIMTSATLTVEGSFDYVKGRLGVGDADSVRVKSEFDFREQAILYLPRQMPSPKSHEYPEAVTREVLDLLIRTEGRAFVLFTSYAMLRTVRDRVERSLPYPIIVQGTAPRSTLLNQFRTTPNAVLFATSSFWQGVDVVGEQLSCVIIDKLPFASPGDPITAARIETILANGGDAFQEYQVPLAILAMLQGLGRLIRHRTDRGVLAVLDPRLRTMAYGQRFLDSFPPAPITHDPEAITRFFGN
ncbi:MAG TPA: ATP-dependent DNA helicase [Vicinamibacterales bacterium]|nr:ATP-dependent DNA helicase [Vicinamibacterales bacterium]